MRIRRTQASSSSSSSKSQRSVKKQKRLDAICEKEYNRNRFGEAEPSGSGILEDEAIRRSSRVRKAPVVLDMSSPPVKKRRKGVDSGGVSFSKNEGFVESGKGEDVLEGGGSWKSRLRHTVNSGSLGLKEKFNLRSSSRRKLSDEWEEMEENEVVVLPKSKKKKRGKVRVSGSQKRDRNDRDLEDGVLPLDEDNNVDGSSIQLVEEEERKMLDELLVGDEQSGSRKLDQCVKQVEQVECQKEGADYSVSTEAVGHSSDKLNNGGSTTGKDDRSAAVDKNHIEDKNVDVDKSKQFSADMLDKRHTQKGRRCGLCGRGTDGKPPKRLAAEPTDSGNEAYGGSSSCEEGNYDTLDGFGDESGWLGRLLGPIHDRFGIADVWVHQHCAVWSPEVYFAGLGCLKNVRAALSRGKLLKCSRCGRPGATIGCRVDRCPKNYHLPCGRANGCIFDHRKFLIACNEHQHLFEPHSTNDLQRLKKLKVKKLKLETRKHSYDAWKKDFEAEEKWLENCGEDEEFLKREGKRLQRDILRIAPVYIGASSTEIGKQYQGWESVAGLQDVIQCMKELVLLPLLYPEFFTTIGLTPPRGVLLHGYPGTGKTHVVRALIGACARGDRRIAYFARKGADCLGKYVGDAERQLRLLFQVAERSQPSIIFFDEIDGLAPCRTRQQDQTHNSVVSTLLALMDGLKSRGSVVVIGATNRPDAVDPALRRPGRFDREIYFPLPSVTDRAAILSLHTQSWSNPISGSLLKRIAQRTSGFAGADLQALCTQAAMIALKRNCPLHELMSAAEKETNSGRHLSLPSSLVEEVDWLDALACAPPPCSRREAGMAANDVVSSPMQAHLVPCLLQPLSYLLVSLYLDDRVWLPYSLGRAAEFIKTVIVSALDHREKSSDLWWSFLPDLIKEADIAKQIEEKLSCAGFLISGSSLTNYTASPDNYDDAGSEFKLRKVSSAGARATLSQNISCSDRNSGFRVLITGHPKSGQRHLASCLLHGFVGCVEIQKVDLATISQGGHGDLIEGMTNILSNCSSKGLCLLYMPRIDLWAMEETQDQVDEKADNSSSSMCGAADTEGPCVAKITSSRVWNAFMEQVDSIRLSASLMILATSEVSSDDLPHRINQFFTSNALSLNDSTISKHTLPRFVVQVGGRVDFDMMINSSVTQLSRDVVQQYVQLVHHSTHAAAKRSDNRTADVIVENEVKNDNTLNRTSTCGDEDVIPLRTPDGFDSFCVNKIQQNIHSDDQCPTLVKATGHKEADIRVSKDTVPKVPCLSRTEKGKSNLLLAISSFGYQILLYPHFAELCWTTSKLKEGPCADINGPWKGWPFSSCIIRPGKTLEKVSLGRSSSNLKDKEGFGVVRGLVAVGLLAYKGVYTSIREVSFEVRKVLELLVEQLNAKLLAGKDRSRSYYLLSQVAYLEDMVNSWAYTLQSLECDISIPASPEAMIEHHPSSERNAVASVVCKTNNSQKSSDEVEVQGQHECVGSTTSKQPLHEINSLVQPSRDSLHQKSTLSVNVLAGGNTLDTMKEVNNDEPENTAVDLHRGSLRTSEKSDLLANGIIPENSVCSHDELNVTDSNFKRVSDRQKGLSMKKMVLTSNDNTHKSDGVVENSNSTLNKHVTHSPTCLYGCCNKCIDLIYELIRKILICEWKTIGSSWTVEDAHDAVCSWSTHLLSAVKRLYAAESLRKSEVISRNSSHETDTRLCTCSSVDHRRPNRNSRVISSENGVAIPMECSFHSNRQNVKGYTNASTKSQVGGGLKLTFKDNVLVSSDLDNDVLYHCEYQKLCLNTLIEWITMIKQPPS